MLTSKVEHTRLITVLFVWRNSMDFKEELRAAAEQCAQDQRNTADHLVRQAFFAGVGWYMAFLRQKAAEPQKPTNVS
jgi:hypothetical protein